jgi:hypothetical protein
MLKMKSIVPRLDVSQFRLYLCAPTIALAYANGAAIFCHLNGSFLGRSIKVQLVQKSACQSTPMRGILGCKRIAQAALNADYLIKTMRISKGTHVLAVFQ